LKGTEEEFLEDDGGDVELYSELLMDGPVLVIFILGR
jgi:hypothetical protein